MSKYIDVKGLLDEVNTGYVSMRKHPESDIFIFNYTSACQFEQRWNINTKQARGLILDEDFNILARPFPKFFNFEEHKPEEIPNLPFEVFEKLDGSLGILYWIKDIPYIATRGSFESEQAIRGTKMLHTDYLNRWNRLNKNYTYLFEIVYPGNRIVVDYGDKEMLILLGVINTDTGEELPLSDFMDLFVIPQKYSVGQLDELLKLDDHNKEGFVIKYSNNFRIKVKFEEYKRLHKLITQCSNKDIWKSLSEGRPLTELLDRVPDEFYQWVKITTDGLLNKYNAIVECCKHSYKTFPTRKETAEYFKTQPYQAVLFAMLDGKDANKIIWKLIKPTYSKPFKIEI